MRPPFGAREREGLAVLREEVDVLFERRFARPGSGIGPMAFDVSFGVFGDVHAATIAPAPASPIHQRSTFHVPLSHTAAVRLAVDP